MKRILLSLLFAMSLSFVSFGGTAIANHEVDPATGQPIVHIADQDSKDEACNALPDPSSCGQNNDPSVQNLFQSIADFLLLIIGGIAVIVLIVSGIRFAVSNGDPQGVQGARNGILYALIGVVVAVFANVIVRFVLGRI